jgi:hypothetical protein
MEFLNWIVIFIAAFLVFRRPERERLAFTLLIVSIVLMVYLFSVGTHTSLLPALNY